MKKFFIQKRIIDLESHADELMISNAIIPIEFNSFKEANKYLLSITNCFQYISKELYRSVQRHGIMMLNSKKHIFDGKESYLSLFQGDETSSIQLHYSDVCIQYSLTSMNAKDVLYCIMERTYNGSKMQFQLFGPHIFTDLPEALSYYTDLKLSEEAFEPKKYFDGINVFNRQSIIKDEDFVIHYVQELLKGNTSLATLSTFIDREFLIEQLKKQQHIESFIYPF